MSATRCKHENAEHMLPGDSSTPDWCVTVSAQCEQFRCLDCGAWLSLGEANESVPRDEMDLAKLLADIHVLWEPGRDRIERVAHVIDTYSNGLDPLQSGDGWRAGR